MVILQHSTFDARENENSSCEWFVVVTASQAALFCLSVLCLFTALNCLIRAGSENSFLIQNMN